MDDRTVRKELAFYANRCYEKDLLVGGEGNISARLENGNVLVTPTGCSLGDVGPEDFVEVDMDGNVVDGRNIKPSSETKMHLEIYKARPDMKSVCHCHPKNAVAYALCHAELPWKVHPEVVAYLGPIPTIPYGRPSTIELAKTCAKYMPTGVYGAVMENHGTIGIGITIMDAFRRNEVIESFAYSCLMAKLVGVPVELPQSDIEVMLIK